MEDFKTGYFVGNGLAVNIILGWVPDFVMLIGDMTTSLDMLYWQSSACRAAGGGGSQNGWISDIAQGSANLALNGAAATGIVDYNADVNMASVLSPIVNRGEVKKPVTLYTAYTAVAPIARTATIVGSVIQPTVRNGRLYECTTSNAVTTAAGEPTWPITPGATVTAETNVWTCIESKLSKGGGQGFTVGATVVANGELAVFWAWRTDDEKYMGDAAQGDLKL